MLILLCLSLLGSDYLTIAQSKSTQNKLAIGKHAVYLGAEQQEWIKTVTRTSNFIIEHTDKNDAFLAIPYEPIYHVLTHRNNGIREPSFFTGIDEEKTIKIIENKNINMILVSNRAFKNTEGRWGRFGEKYGKKLLPYIETHFKPTSTFGPWSKPANSLINHAVTIYRRM